MRRRTRSTTRLAGVGVTLLLLAACSNAAGETDLGDAPDGSSKPNVVMVLTDDLDSGLLQFMPQVQAMQKEGVDFVDYSVSDTLCCPSRASILSGQYPHNTGIFTNSGDDGGFAEFHRRGGEESTIGTQMQEAGYQTAFMGKYLNGYQPKDPMGGQAPYVPPGWNNWAVAGAGYKQYDYQLNENGKIVDYGSAPEDYLTDVMAGKSNEFIKANAAAGQSFYLQVNTFSPHGPSTPAPRHENEFNDLTAPRGPSFDEADLSDKASWLRDRPALTDEQIKKIDDNYRERARSVLAIDDLLAGVRATLQETGQSDNTYVMFTSDNGFHMGEHRLASGKQTAFSTDVTVPLVATGPGVPEGHSVDAQAQNIDLRPTFGDIAGAPPVDNVDGHSLLPLLRGEEAESRTASLIEHHGPNKMKDDPDRQDDASGNPPTYSALRTPDGTYVEYENGEYEYYDRHTDPDQLTNTYPGLPEEQKAALRDTLTGLVACKGGQACWAAGQPLN